MAASGHPAARGGTEIGARVDGRVASLLPRPGGRGRGDSISRSVVLIKHLAVLIRPPQTFSLIDNWRPFRIGPALRYQNSISCRPFRQTADEFDLLADFWPIDSVPSHILDGRLHRNT